MGDLRQEIAQDFGAHAKEYDRYAELQRTVAENAAHALLCKRTYDDNSRVLDVGCGTGMASDALREQGFSGEISGVDLASPMVGAALKRGVKAQLGDMHALPYEDAVFDAVISSSALQWSNDLPRAFSEIVRVLKMGGVASISLFGAESLQEFHEMCEAVGYSAPLVPLPSESEIRDVVSNLPHVQARISSKIQRYDYVDVVELMRSMSRIGAGYKGGALQHNRYLSKQKLAAMKQYYTDHYFRQKNDQHRVYASWHILSILIQKAG